VDDAYTYAPQDGGGMSTDTTLTVNLVDVLDPPPAFSLTQYNVEVAEGTYSDVSELNCLVLLIAQQLVLMYVVES
jgi:hypothetical protein